MADAPPPPMGPLVQGADAGNPNAHNELFSTLYRELHRLAQSHLARSSGPITLSATTLLHEAYLDISRRDNLAFPDQNRFLAYASRAMRGLVIDYIRSKRAVKRGGDLTLLAIDDAGADGTFEHLDLALKSGSAAHSNRPHATPMRAATRIGSPLFDRRTIVRITCPAGSSTTTQVLLHPVPYRRAPLHQLLRNVQTGVGLDLLAAGTRPDRIPDALRQLAQAGRPFDSRLNG
jgi:DNA-directed RNA polymerase specialized sigma24 family protein